MKQHLRTGIFLAGGKSGPLQACEPLDSLFLVGRDDQSALTPGPFDKDNGHGCATPEDGRRIPGLCIGIVEMQPRRHAFAGGQPAQTVLTAVEEGRQARA